MTRALAFALSFAGLLAIWQVIPPQTPALYDGTCSPDPYRYVVNNPAGIAAPAPVSETVQLVSGQVPTIQVIADDNNDPQAQILVLAGSITIPAGTQSVKVTITPLAPPKTQPKGAHVDGNMYEFDVTTDGGAAAVFKESPTIVLRGTNSPAATRTLQQFDGQSWKPLKSTSLGCADTLEAPAITLGKFAIVATGTKTPSPTEPSSSFPWGVLVLALALLAFGAALSVINRRRNYR
jgi:hypothetical protein